MAIRSGRFKGDASGTNGIPIIAARSKAEAAYRIFNSGVKPDQVFSVDAGYATVPELQPACSIDVLIEKRSYVAIRRGTPEEVVGSYDYLDGGDASRSGRFMGNASGDGMTIILGRRSGTFYRIFNSGKENFEVHVGSSVTLLAPTLSLDVVVDEDVVIKRSDSKQVEGIYEYLDAQSLVRSGRFNLKAPAAAHKIIDLNATSATPEAFYRIFNSGDKNFKVQEAGVKLAELAKEQSFDFAVANKRDITVVATQGYPIEGIYDFLGSRD